MRGDFFRAPFLAFSLACLHKLRLEMVERGGDVKKHRAFEHGIRFLGMLVFLLGCISLLVRLDNHAALAYDGQVVRLLLHGNFEFGLLMYLVQPFAYLLIGVYFTLNSQEVANLLPVPEQDVDEHVS